MSPRRLVAALLEADEAPPVEQDFNPDRESGIDVKSLIHRAGDSTPLAIYGVSIRGTHAEFTRKFEQRRLKKDGPTEYFKIEKNTLLVRDTHTGDISVKFHWTDILTVTPDDTLTVNNGDYFTMTTMRRLNEYLPSGWGVYVKNGSWYWHVYGHDDDAANPGFKMTQAYSNGDKITADGTLHARVGPEFKKVRVARNAGL